MKADPRALETARRASLVVLDIDGVLVDPRPSFYAAATETASWGATRVLDRQVQPITGDDIRAFKSVGGWNDDFDLACACTWALIARDMLPIPEFARRASGGLAALARVIAEILPPQLHERATQLLPTRLLRERAAVRYAGRARCFDLYGIEPETFPDLPVDGLWMDEPLLCAPASLKRLGKPFGIFTGRNGPEADIVLERFDLFIPPALKMVDDSQTPRKPAPDALLKIAKEISGPFLFVGDSIDDECAAKAYNTRQGQPELVFVRIVEGDPTESGSEAPIVASSLDALVEAIRPAEKEKAR